MRQSVVQPPLSKCYHTTSRNCWFGFQFTTQLETWCLGVVWLPLQSWTSRPVTGAAHFSWIFLQPGAQGKLNDRATPLAIQLQNSSPSHLAYSGMLNRFLKLWFAFSLPSLSTNVLPLDFYFCFFQLAFSFPDMLSCPPFPCAPSCPPSCLLACFSFCWATASHLHSTPLTLLASQTEQKPQKQTERSTTQELGSRLLPSPLILPPWNFGGRRGAGIRISVGTAVPLKHLWPHQPLVSCHLESVSQVWGISLVPDNLHHSQVSPLFFSAWWETLTKGRNEERLGQFLVISPCSLLTEVFRMGKIRDVQPFIPLPHVPCEVVNELGLT